MNELSSADVGSVLRQARLRRGQSLEVVQQQTRIPKKMLEALESNRFEEFPAIVYLRGFLKGYCDHLDLEFDALWPQIDPARPKAEPEPAPGGKMASPAASAAAPSPAAPAHKPAPAAAQPHHDDGEALGDTGMLPVLLLGALLGGAALVWLLNREKKAPPPPPPPPVAIAPLTTPAEMSLRIVSRTDAWMQLHTDGVLRFQGRAPAGYSQEWKASDSFTLRTKDPAGLGLTLDGKELALSDSLKTSSGDYKIVRQ